MASSDKISNILILRLDSYGDLVLSSQLIPILRQNYPDAEISWAIYDTYSDYLLNVPGIDHILKLPKNSLRKQLPLINQIRKKAFDLVIDLHDLGFIPSLTSFLIKAKEKVGYKTAGYLGFKNKTLTMPIQLDFKRHMSKNYENVLRQLDINGQIYEKLAHSDGDNSGYSDAAPILIAPFSQHNYKTWDVNSWIKTIQHIQKNFPNNKLLIAGSSQQKFVVDKILSHESLKTYSNIQNISGQTNIQEVEELIKKCFFLITVDSCFSHFATINRAPVIALIHDYAYDRWCPLGKYAYSIINKNDRLQTSLPLKKRSSFVNISPEMLCNTIDKLANELKLATVK